MVVVNFLEVVPKLHFGYQILTLYVFLLCKKVNEVFVTFGYAKKNLVAIHLKRKYDLTIERKIGSIFTLYNILSTDQTNGDFKTNIKKQVIKTFNLIEKEYILISKCSDIS